MGSVSAVSLDAAYLDPLSSPPQLVAHVSTERRHRFLRSAVGLFIYFTKKINGRQTRVLGGLLIDRLVVYAPASLPATVPRPLSTKYMLLLYY
jgi:hypothetical protein